MKRILIVEDDVNLGTTLADVLEMHDFKVLYLTNGDQILEKVKHFKPDIVILDVMLNGTLNGFEIAKLIRKENNSPILFTTSRDGNEDLKTGFSIENTDYIRKPYRLIEVTLRINNLLSLYEKTTKKIEPIPIGHFSFFPKEHSLKFEYDKIHLNNYESAVLVFLCQNKNNFIRRDKIIEAVWNEKDYSLKEGSLNNIITRLRKNLNQDTDVTLESKIKLGVRLTINN
jgi:DNA-binding response OmpR family regulator